MSAVDSRIEEQAIAWIIRSRDRDFDDWDALTHWLEADQTHADAFRSMSLLDDMLSDLPARKESVSFPTTGKWPAAAFGSVAAVFIAVITISMFFISPFSYSVETGPGERRIVALSDGSQIALNGDTELSVSRLDDRHAELVRGEALFTVVHNEQDPFVVTVGDAIVKDEGTVFNIIRAGENTEVGVSEGLVSYNQIAVRPGFALRVSGDRGSPKISPVPTSAVGSWRRNQLTYSGAEIRRVASDLSRSLGVQVTVADDVRNLQFTGTINLKKDIGRFFSESAPVLGVRAKRVSDGWMLVGGDETGS